MKAAVSQDGTAGSGGGRPDRIGGASRRWRRRGLAAFVVVLALVGFFRWQITSGRAEFQRRLAAIRAAGEPLLAEDFAARQPDPPPELDLGRLLRSTVPPGSSREYPWLSADCFSEVLAATNTWVLAPELLERVRLATVSNAPTVAVLLSTDLTGFRFRAGWTNGWQHVIFRTPGGPLEEYPAGRLDVGSALALQAVYEAESERPIEAVTALVRGFQLARVPSYMGLEGGFSQMCVDGMMLRAMERVLNRTVLNTADLGRLVKALHWRYDPMRETLLLERAFFVFSWVHPTRGAGMARWSSVGQLAGLVGMNLRGYSGRLEMLDRWQRRLAALDRPGKEGVDTYLATIAEVERQTRGPLNWSGRLLRQLSFDHHLRVSLEPKYLGFFGFHSLSPPALANAHTALAVERWRLDHAGRVPEALSELVPGYLDAVPLDPGDGRPLRYQRLARGYRLYCVGPDGTDDGGREGQFSGAPGTDMTFRVER